MRGQALPFLLFSPFVHYQLQGTWHRGESGVGETPRIESPTPQKWRSFSSQLVRVVRRGESISVSLLVAYLNMLRVNVCDSKIAGFDNAKIYVYLALRCLPRAMVVRLDALR